MATVNINPLEIVQGLEERCWQCSSTPLSKRDSEGNLPNCNICRGKGYDLTDAGRAMLAFLERWKG